MPRRVSALLLLLLLPLPLALSCGGSAPPPRRHAGHHHHRDAPGEHSEYRTHRKHHRFHDAERWAKIFESPKRDAWQRPDALVAALGLRPGDRVADIGAATGYLTVRLARAVPQGKVYGFDIEPDMVRYLAARATREKLGNLTALAAAKDAIRSPEPLDLVFTCNTYHHLPDRVAYFKRLAAQLKPGGRVAVVDFKMGPLPVGPPERERVPLPTLHAELTAAGFVKVSHDVTTLPHQYIAIYRKAP